MLKFKYSTNKVTYLSWVKYFFDSAEKNNPHKLDALLAYWLSNFSFPSPTEDGLNNFVFPTAVLLAQKKKFTVGPWYLGALYA